MTYSLTRFAIYETVRDQVAQGSQGPLPFYKKVLLGSISGEQLRGRGPGGGRASGVCLGGAAGALPVVTCWLPGLSPQVALEVSWALLQTWSTSGQCRSPKVRVFPVSPDRVRAPPR